MKLALTAALAAAGLALAPAALAQPGQFYVTAGYAHINSDDVDLGAAVFRGGYNFTENFGGELELGFGINDDTIGGVKVELKNSIGAFGVVRAPIAPNFDVFARAGVVRSEVKASFGGSSASDDDTALALGLGGNLGFNEYHGLRFGYTWQDYDESANVFDISYVLRF
jgi:outer membrane immunogenic protein